MGMRMEPGSICVNWDCGSNRGLPVKIGHVSVNRICECK